MAGLGSSLTPMLEKAAGTFSKGKYCQEVSPRTTSTCLFLLQYLPEAMPRGLDLYMLLLGKARFQSPMYPMASILSS